MSAFWTLLPLVVLFTVVGVGSYVGYQIYLWSNQLAQRGVNHMEKKNVVFTKDGMKVGVKQLSEEDYAARQQSLLVKTWNLSSFPAYKSWLWNKQDTDTPNVSALPSSPASTTSRFGRRSRSSSNAHSNANSPLPGTPAYGSMTPTESSGRNLSLNVPSSRPSVGRRGSSSIGAFPEDD